MPNVTLFAGDLSNPADVAGALEGVTRALLVTGAFSYEQFEVESLFIEAAAKAGLEVTVRVSTHSGLIKAGTKGAYGRTHHGLEAFIKAGSYKVVDLCPDWFLSNWFGNAGEAKSTGKISLPVPGTGPGTTLIDPNDVGLAAAAILSLPTPALAPFLAKGKIEVKGASKANFAEVAAALTQALGYSIELQPIPPPAFVAFLQSLGIPRVFATSFLETYQQMDGVVPQGYEGYGADLFNWPTESSPELLAIGWKPKTLEEWANAPGTKAVFGK
jgi:uncharacterized protein YbjT (DUF2867 family)